MLGHFPIFSSLLLFLLLLSVAGKETFKGWKVMTADIATQEQLDSVKAMDLDVWSGCSSLVIGKNDIRMQDTHDGNFIAAAIPTVSLIPDIENYIEYEDNDKTLDIGISSHSEDWHTKYHTYEQIVGFLGMYAEENVGVTYTEIGTTHEGNKIPAVVVSGPGEGPKKSVLIVGGLQAREWASTATILYFYRTLISYIQSDAKLANIDVHIIPVANPDGYIYSWEEDRLWRNNRRDNSDGSFGVDLDRNFGYEWGVGCPTDKTSDTYCGTEAFSEPETQAIRDYITNNGQFAGAVEYSSYSQAILRPFALSTTAPPRAALLQTIADEWASIVTSVNKFTYASEPAYQHFPVAGNFRDYMVNVANVPMSFTVQLRDTGSYGYFLPACQLLDTAKENWEGLKYFLHSVASLA